MNVNTSLLKSIQTIVNKAMEVAAFDKTRQAQVINKTDNGTYTIRLDGVLYYNVPSYPRCDLIGIGDVVKVIIPSNQHNQMYIEIPKIQQYILAAHPVGSYYETSDVSFNPNVSWGGTWVLEIAGMVHVSGGTGYAVAKANNDGGKGAKDGGEVTHVLTPAETAMKKHGHTHAHTHGMTHSHPAGTDRAFVTNVSGAGIGEKRVTSASSGGFIAPSLSKGTDDNWWGSANTANSAKTATDGASTTATSETQDANGAAHNNMQPYINVNRWHRIA